MVQIPKNNCICFIFLEAGTCCIDSIFSGDVFIPGAVKVNPKNVVSLVLSFGLSSFKVILLSSNSCNIRFIPWQCSFQSQEVISKSSMYAVIDCSTSGPSTMSMHCMNIAKELTRSNGSLCNW